MKSLKLVVLAGVIAAMSACTAITDVTSSTSSTLDAATPDVTLNQFINTRYVALQQDAARGQGENIEALAQLMGEGDAQRLAGWMQQHYATLFTQGQTGEGLMAQLESYKTQPKG